ncbi:MAG TPA: AMP-binding protein, partial [Blastocatellia bacterium]
GDAVAIILVQSAPFLVAQFAALKLGAVVVPVSPSLPPSTSRLALKDCDARAVVTSRDALDRMGGAITSERLFVVGTGSPLDHSGDGQKDFWREVNYSPSDFSPVVTSPDSPAFIFFHSPCEGSLTGVVHSHRSLIGQLTAFEMCAGFSRGEDSAFWAAGDWTTPEALLGIINPALWYGRPIVARAGAGFDGEFFDLMEHLEVSDIFVPPPELFRLKQEGGDTGVKRDLKLRSILTTPGAFTQELYDWAGGSLGATLNVVCGTPETGIISANCEDWFASISGAAGRPAPGHSIELVDEGGNVLPAGRTGIVALSSFDPCLFLGYLNDSEKAISRSAGGRFLTGVTGYKKEDGDLFLSPSSNEFRG